MVTSVFFGLAAIPAETATPTSSRFLWTPLPSLPDPVGVAGPFSGAIDGALVVGGGANFPSGRPWNGAPKIWHDTLYLLSDPNGAWIVAGQKLPRPIAYGVSIDSPLGLACLGGGDAEQHYADAFLLKRRGTTLEHVPLPPLPRPVANACGARLGDTLYVAGGLESPGSTNTLNTFWKLDLSATNPAWDILEPWPGPPRMLAVAGVQDGSFFLCSGVDLVPDAQGRPSRSYLRDAYRYRPQHGWSRIADLPRPAAAAPSPAMILGQSHLGIVGGDDGHFAAKVAELRDTHPGFPSDLLAYHTITDTWTVLGHFPTDPGPDPAAQPELGDWPAVTAAAADWRDGYVVASGEARPGVRTTKVWSATLLRGPTPFGWLNFSVLGVYLAGMILVGAMVARRNRSTDDFFRGGQRIPWWAAGLSIYATMLSSLTYMSVPAKAFATNWEYLVGYPFILITAAITVSLVLPFFRRIDATSAYEYLEKRFNRASRWIGSGLFILFQLGRIAIVLFLSALALDTITPLTTAQCVLLMGCLSLVYSVLGGVEAVVWTDAIQSAVLLGGAILCLGVVFWHLGGDLGGFFAAAAADSKFHMINWDWDAASHATAAFWVLAVGALGQNLVSYTSDQAVVQRYLTTPSRKLAARSIWLNGWLAIPTGVLFFLLGTALYVFYKSRPDQLDPTFNTDAILPLFIARQLPEGVAGLVVAGIFAAAQSTVSTSMNSTATAFVTDFCPPRPASGTRAGSGSGRLRLARMMTLMFGMAGTGLALLFSAGNIKSLLDQFFAVLGLFGGSLGGLFLLGMFTRRATGAGAIVGAVLGAAVTLWVQRATQTHVYLHAAVGLSVCFAAGWQASLVLPKPHKSIAGLTIFDTAD